MSVLATSILPCIQMDKDSELVTVIVIVVTVEYCSQYRALNWICMSEVSVRICGTVLQFVCTSEWNTEISSIESIQCDLGNAIHSYVIHTTECTHIGFHYPEWASQRNLHLLIPLFLWIQRMNVKVIVGFALVTIVYKNKRNYHTLELLSYILLVCSSHLRIITMDIINSRSWINVFAKRKRQSGLL